MDSKSAREQFRESITLVLMNERTAYREVMQMAHDVRNDEFAVVRLSERIQEMVERVIENSIKSNHELGAMLIRELCFGWGTDAYLGLAREILSEMKLQDKAGV